MKEIPKWVLEKLCYYDKRNPDSHCDDEDEIIEANDFCMCDNCFYGRTKLAEYIIEILKKEIEWNKR